MKIEIRSSKKNVEPTQQNKNIYTDSTNTRARPEPISSIAAIRMGGSN